MASKKPTSIFNRKFILLWIIMMFTRACMVSDKGISAALESVGLNSAIIGSLSTIFGLMAVVGRIVTGPASVTVKPHLMLAFSMLLDAGAFFCYAVPVVQVYAVGRILEGLTYAFQGPASMMILADSIVEEKYNTAIGVFTTRSYAGSILGPIVFFSVLVRFFGYFGAYFWVGVVLLILAFASLTLKVDDFTPQPFKITVKNIVAPECIMPLIFMLSLAVTYTAVDFFIAAYAVQQGITEDGISIILAVSSVVTIVMGVAGSMLADKIGLRAVMLPSVILYAVGLVLFALADNLAMFVIAAIPVNGFYTVIGNLISAMCVRQVEPERRGVASGTFSLAYDVGFMIGPVIVGVLAAKVGYSATFMWCLVPCALSLILLGLFWKTLTQLDNEAKAAAKG